MKRSKILLLVLAAGALVLGIIALVLWLIVGQTKPSPPDLTGNVANILKKIQLAPLNPQRGIHAPVGYRWADSDRATLDSFRDKNGLPRGPGMVLALSSDLEAANNSAGVSMERDLMRYQQSGAEIYVRMYPQRFPGGLTEAFASDRGNTISGEPQDAVNDIITFLKAQQKRTGTHFTRIIPGNEANIEWPNGAYYYNLLRWRSNNDPTKYEAMNRFFVDLYTAWETRLQQADAAPFRDVKLYFPALSQDGSPNYFGGFYFYDQNGQPVGNKYDRLQAAVRRYPGFSWHNYWRPGKVWEDRAAAHFPDWLKQSLSGGTLPAVITESGWTPDALQPVLTDEQREYYALWRGPPWSWFGPISVPTPTQDDIINGVRFEDELKFFVEQSSGAVSDLPRGAQAVAVWLTSSGGYFNEAVGIERDGTVRRWFRDYADWRK